MTVDISNPSLPVKLLGFVLTVVGTAVTTGVWMGGGAEKIKTNSANIERNTSAIESLDTEVGSAREDMHKLVILFTAIGTKFDAFSAQYKIDRADMRSCRDRER